MPEQLRGIHLSSLSTGHLCRAQDNRDSLMEQGLKRGGRAHQELALDEVFDALLDLLDVRLEHALQLLHHLQHQLRPDKQYALSQALVRKESTPEVCHASYPD